MALRIHAELTGDSASLVQATRESQAAIVQVGAAAQKVIADAQRAASVGAQIDRMFAPAGAARDRAADIAAYGAELDALRAKFNPLFAAQQRYEALVAEIARAERLGAISTAEAAAARTRATAELTAASGQLAGGMRGLGASGIQNLSYQIADFSAQVAAGGSPVVALAQQLPQLAGGFGVVGAAIGAVAAVGIPLAALAFRELSDETESLDDQLDDLNKAMTAAKGASDILGLAQQDLAKKYAGTAAQVEMIRRAVIETSLADLDAKIRGAATGAFGELESGLQRVQAEAAEVRQRMEAMGRSFEGFSVEHIATRLGQSVEFTQLAMAAMERFNGAASSAERNSALLETLQSLEAMKAEAGSLEPAAQAFYEELRRVAPELSAATAQALSLEGGISGAGGAIGAAADEAGRLADALGRAVDNAVAAAGAARRAASDAQLQLQYHGDPVGLAVARAGSAADADAAALGAVDPTIANVLHQARMDRIQGAYEEATALEELTRRRKADAEAARESAGGARGGRGKRSPAETAAREAERGREAVTKLIASLRAEQDTMHASDPVQQEMIRLRERMTYATVEQRVTIEDLVRTNLAQDDALQSQIERMDELREAGHEALATIRDGLLEGASAGNILGSVLSGIGDRLMDLGTQGISDVLFGKKGTAGGGVLGSVLSSILPFAQGGVVTSPTLFGFGGGRVGLMGEAGPEAIMPLAAGMVGARVGGRETRLPITRLASGDLGVSVTPFARGGVVTPGPLAWAASGPAGGQGGGAAGAQGRMRIELALSQDLEARLLEEAGAQADVKITRGLKQFDRALPGKVDRIRKDSSYRGSR